MNWSELVETRPVRIALMVGVFITLFIAIGSWLPTRWRVEQEAVIAAPPAAVFPYLNSLKKWRDWTVWYETNPDLATEYSGPESGMGATSRWNDGHHRGALKIMASRPNAQVDYLVIFDGGEWEMQGLLRLTPVEGGKTRVEWRAGGEVGANPLQRYMTLMVKWWVGADMKRSLERLRGVAEAQHEPAREPPMSSGKQK